jgi:serine/threonine-protein kinase HipA
LDTAEIALQGAQGRWAGARPKIKIGMDEIGDAFVIDYGDPLKPGFEPWLVKSRSTDDCSDIAVEEQAYALMARAAGLMMGDARVQRTEKPNEPGPD